MKKLLAILTLAALPALAASPDGTWVRQIGKKGQSQKLVLSSSGDKLTGTFEQTGSRVGTVAITDGQIKGSEISFKVVRELPDKTRLTQIWRGTVQPFQLNLSVENQELENQARLSEYVFYKTK